RRGVPDLRSPGLGGLGGRAVCAVLPDRGSAPADGYRPRWRLGLCRCRAAAGGGVPLPARRAPLRWHLVAAHRLVLPVRPGHRGRLRPTNTRLRTANALLRDPRPACRREGGRSRTRGSVRWLGEPVLDLGEQLLRGALRGTG